MTGMRKDGMSTNRMRWHTKVKKWAKQWTSKQRRRKEKQYGTAREQAE